MVSILDREPPSPDARIPYGPNASQFGDLRVPAGDGPHPAVVLIHGGFWRARYSLEHAGHMAAALREAGAAVWSIEYRRTGEPGGGWPETFQDVARACDFLRELGPQYDFDLARVIAVGHSAGGHLALWAAARTHLPQGTPVTSLYPLPLRGALSLAGVLDLYEAWRLQLSNNAVGELMGGGPDDKPLPYTLASPFAMVPLGLPQILIHGEADDTVPAAFSRRYAEAAQAAGDPARLIVLPEVGHFELIDPETEVWQVVEREALSLLEG